MKMDRKTATVLSFLLVSCLLSVIANAEGVDVQIDVLSKPETCDKIAKNGDTISMNYKGNLYDVTTKEIGKEFDSNYDRPGTFDFKLGAGQVIQGWEKGVPGMCVGEKRKLTVPPELAYGDVGFSDIIPPKSTLVFEIELVDVKAASDAHDHHGVQHDHEADSFTAIDANGDKQITSEEMAAYIKKFNEEGSEADKFDNIDTIVGEIFQEDDKNKDGVISLDEYQQFEDGYDGDIEQQMEDEDNADAQGADDEEDEEDADGQRDEL